MNARDELAKVISDHRTPWVTNTEHRAMEAAQAEAILAAGYSKPRTITTAEELDALPFESVLRDAEGHVLERWGGPDENLWVTVMVTKFIPSADIALPAALIYEGAE